jgi:hypothetical protein
MKANEEAIFMEVNLDKKERKLLIKVLLYFRDNELQTDMSVNNLIDKLWKLTWGIDSKGKVFEKGD